MNNDLKEQPSINFDDDNELEGTHEIFTNLPNNTLNGVNPVFDGDKTMEIKTEVMQDLVSNVNSSINFDEEVKKDEVVTTVENEVVNENPAVNDNTGINMDSSIANEGLVVNESVNVTNEATPINNESVIGSDPLVINEEVTNVSEAVSNNVSETTPVESSQSKPIQDETVINSLKQVNVEQATNTNVVNPNTNELNTNLNKNEKKSKIGIIVALIIIFVAVGIVALVLYLGTNKKASSATTTTSNTDASGASSVAKLEYTTVNLSDLTTNYVDSEITVVSTENTLKVLKDKVRDILTILTDGTISPILKVGDTSYNPLEVNGTKLKYLYGFYDEQGYHIITTDNKLYLYSYSYDATGTITSGNLILQSDVVVSYGTKCVDLNNNVYNVVVTNVEGSKNEFLAVSVIN